MTNTLEIKDYIFLLCTQANSFLSIGLQKYHVTETGDLVIQNITKEDRGNYKCKATQLENGFTDFGARVIQLKVERKYINNIIS